MDFSMILSTLTTSHILRVSKLLVKISQFNFLVGYDIEVS